MQKVESGRKNLEFFIGSKTPFSALKFHRAVFWLSLFGKSLKLAVFSIETGFENLLFAEKEVIIGPLSGKFLTRPVTRSAGPVIGRTTKKYERRKLHG